MAEVFISYSRKDKDFVKRLSDALAKLDQKPWVDWKDIPPTAEWKQEIFSAIEAADAFVLVISPEYIASEVCQQEIAHALECHKRLIPLVYREVDAKAAPEAVSKRNWIFFRESDDFEASVKSLLEAIDTDLDWVRAHTRFLTRASEWEQKGQDKSLLLRGRDLKEAEQWLAQSGQKEPQPTTLHGQYISASRQASTSRQVWLAFVLGVLAMAILVAIYIYYQKKNTEQVALSRQLAFQSRSLLSSRPDSALLLSVEANNVAESIKRKGNLLWGMFTKAILDLSKTNSDVVEAKWSLLEGLTREMPAVSFLRGKGIIDSITYSGDGKILASGNRYGQIMLWDAIEHKPLCPAFQGHKEIIRSVAFNPVRPILASGGDDGKIMLWDVTKLDSQGKPQGRLLGTHGERVWSLAFSPDGKTLASGSSDRTIILWNLDNPEVEPSPLKGHRAAVLSLAFNRDGKTLASGSEDRTIILWDVSEVANPKRLSETPIEDYTNPKDFQGEIKRLAFSPKDNILASVSDYYIILYDLTEVTKPKRLEPPLTHEHFVEGMAFSTDGQTIAAACANSTIVMWDVKKRLPKGTPLTGHGSMVDVVAFSPDGQTLASASSDGTIILWHAGRLSLLAKSFMGHDRDIESVTFSPNGNILATGTSNNLIILWDVSDANRPKRLGQPLEGHDSTVASLIFKDSTTLISGSWYNSIKFWNLSDPKNPISYFSLSTGHKKIKIMTSLALSPDGKTLASGSGDNTIILWNLERDPDKPQQIGQPLTGHKAGSLEGIECLAFSPVDKILASGAQDGQIILWNIADTNHPKQIDPPLTGMHSIKCLAFSPNGQILAAGASKKTAEGDYHKGIFLWKISNGRIQGLIRVLQGPDNDVRCLAFSPDGKILASGEARGNNPPYIRLWDVATGLPIGPPILTVSTNGLSFSPKSKILASVGSCENPVILWDMDMASWQALACRMANRNLTREEWQQYLGNEPYRATCPGLPIPEK